MNHVFYIQLIDGDCAWTDGCTSTRKLNGSRYKPTLESVWQAIKGEVILSVTDQRPPTAQGFDGVKTIFNPAHVKSVTAFPVPR